MRSTAVLFAFGEWYCFAVVFVCDEWYLLRKFRRRIEYHCKAKPCNITFAQQKYHDVFDGISLIISPINQNLKIKIGGWPPIFG